VSAAHRTGKSFSVQLYGKAATVVPGIQVSEQIIKSLYHSDLRHKPLLGLVQVRGKMPIRQYYGGQNDAIG
jgi:hypothetical protein